MSISLLPMPPLEFRRLVGPTADEDFANPDGRPLYEDYGLVSDDIYESVFDFGCGCGRGARQLLQQRSRPRRYVGIDAHRGMVDWCKANLVTPDGSFQFFHHDVYSPGYAPGNSLRLAEAFRVEDVSVSLLMAHSVFTHLSRQQTEYYLSEIERVLNTRGVAFTTWFFFDRDRFPFLNEGPFCLYTSEVDFAQAVIYDRKWFVSTIRRLRLGIRKTVYPVVAGHQWVVLLEKRRPDTIDDFPVEEEGAEWVCGSTLKTRAISSHSHEVLDKVKARSDTKAHDNASGAVAATAQRPQPPPLSGTLAELDAVKRSWNWRIGRIATEPVRAVRRLLGS
jgi:SAM-dependent methyltransferase